MMMERLVLTERIMKMLTGDVPLTLSLSETETEQESLHVKDPVEIIDKTCTQIFKRETSWYSD